MMVKVEGVGHAVQSPCMPAPGPRSEWDNPLTTLEIASAAPSSAAATSGAAAARGRASSPRASASSCCSTKARFEELDKLVTHRCRDFGMESS